MKGFYTFVNNLFILLFIINFLGLFPYILSLTTHISITIFLSSCIIIYCIYIQILKKGLDLFFADFTQEKLPLQLAPFLALIETVSYLARIISLGVRLAANILAGHILISVIANFMSISLSIKIFIIPVLVLSIALNIIILLEMLVSIIQSYIFCLLVCIYFLKYFFKIDTY